MVNKRTLFSAAGLAVLSAALLFSACGGDDFSKYGPYGPGNGADSLVVPEYGEVEVRIVTGDDDDPGTKATETGTSAENAVNGTQVLVFRSGDGLLDTYASVGAGTTFTIEKVLLNAPRTVVVLVNSDLDLSTVGNISELSSKVVGFGAETRSNFQMYGTATMASGAASVTVPIQRFSAKLWIGKVKKQMSVAAYRNEATSSSPGYMMLTSFYALNGQASTNFSFAQGTAAPAYCVGAWSVPSPSSLTQVLRQDIGQQVSDAANGASELTINKYVYVFPSLFTAGNANTVKMVLETTLGGHTYYYPVEVPDVKSNYVYKLNRLTITRPGTDDPNDPLEIGSVTVTLQVVPWTVETVTYEGDNDGDIVM